MTLPLVSIISINYRKENITCDMLDSLSQITYPHYEAIVVDNGALSNQSPVFRDHHEAVQLIISKENLGFAGGNNLAIKQAKGEYILLLNNDTILPKDFLEPLVTWLEEHPDTGIVSPKIYYHDSPQTIQYAGGGEVDLYTGRGKNMTGKHKNDDGSYGESKMVKLAHGACMLVRKSVFEEIGLLREDYFMYYEELDFCYRARQKGWGIAYVADAHIYHRESSTIGRNNPMKTYFMFRNRWLFMRRFANGLQYYCFLFYFLFIGLPLNTLRFTFRRDLAQVKAIWRGVIWNLKHILFKQKAQGNEGIAL